MRKLTYSAVVLVVLMFAVGAGNLFWSAHLAGQARTQAATANRETQQALCTLLDAALATRIKRPADPKAFPAQEATWEWQQRYESVSKTFRC